MRPGRSDIAAPEFPHGTRWLRGTPRPMAALAAQGPVLVHFFDFAQLNSVRSLPYVGEWQRRYPGLAVVGVQSPRFAFGADAEVVERGLERLGVGFAVLLDPGHELWSDYGCGGWPSLFLWGRGGVLRWYHFGEGDYEGTEDAIGEELRLLDRGAEPPPAMAPLRATDAAGARVMRPTPELFPAGEGTPWEAGEGGEIVLDYEAGGAFATVEGEGELAVELDGEAAATVRVDGAGLYELGSHPRHERHSLRLVPAPGLRVWSISFAPGVP